MTDNTNSRRRIFTQGLPAALALVAVGCGKYVISKKAVKQPNDASAGLNGDGTGTPKESVKKGAEPTYDSTKDGGGNGAPVANPALPGTNLAGACNPLDVGQVDISKFENDPSLVGKNELYGSLKSSMVVVSLPQAKAGDYVHLILEREVGKFYIAASRKLSGDDVGKAIVFDGVNLTGAVSAKILLQSGTVKKQVTIKSQASQFTSKYMGKDVIDAGTAISGGIAGFGSTLPIMAYGQATNILQIGIQGRVSEEPAGRPFKVAQDTSVWAMPPDLMTLGTVVTDLLGVAINISDGKLFATTPVFIVYRPKDAATSGYYRYMFFMG